MQPILFKKDFRDYVDIASNLDDESIRPHILRAQDIDLGAVISDNYKNEIITDYTFQDKALSISQTSFEVSSISRYEEGGQFDNAGNTYKITSINNNILTTSPSPVVTNDLIITRYLKPSNIFFYEELLKPFVVYSAAIRFLPFLKTRITNAGLVQKALDQSDEASNTLLLTMREQLLEDRNIYQKRIAETLPQELLKTDKKKYIKTFEAKFIPLFKKQKFSDNVKPNPIERRE